MKKRLQSLLGAVLLPLSAMTVSAQNSSWSASWEFSYRENQFATENQVDFSNGEASFSGSLSADEGIGAYGFLMNAGKANIRKGNFRGKPQKSYFNGTEKARDNDFYVGFRMRSRDDLEETEIFGGAKIRNLYINREQETGDRLEHKLYMERDGRVVGLANEKRGNAGTTGAYYMKDDIGVQLNFMPNNPGARLIFRNLLKKTGEVILDESERLDAEIGHGAKTGNTASLGYNMQRKDGILRKIYLAALFSQKEPKGAAFESSMTLKYKNPMNMRLRYNPESDRTDFNLDLRY